jgi:hypothetical protein
MKKATYLRGIEQYQNDETKREKLYRRKLFERYGWRRASASDAWITRAKRSRLFILGENGIGDRNFLSALPARAG